MCIRAVAGPWNSLIFFQIFKAWKVLENRHGPWKSLSLSLKVHESAWIRFSKAQSLRTERNGFGRKTDGITEFSVLDGKTESTILDGIWTENGKMANWSLKKLSNSFTFIGFTVMFLQFVWENGCLGLLQWKWSTFLSQNERLRSLTCLGHTGRPS